MDATLAALDSGMLLRVAFWCLVAATLVGMFGLFVVWCCLVQSARDDLAEVGYYEPCSGSPFYEDTELVPESTSSAPHVPDVSAPPGPSNARTEHRSCSGANPRHG